MAAQDKKNKMAFENLSPALADALTARGWPVDGVACDTALAAYLAHALHCPACTDTHRWPGASRCPAGADLWRAYLAALPRPETEADRSQTEPLQPIEESTS